MNFLVVYEQSSGKVELECFGDRDEALRARWARELVEADRPGVEVVVLTAESEADLRRTHGRYFRGLSELVREAAANYSA